MISRGLRQLAGIARKSRRHATKLCLTVAVGPRLRREFEAPTAIEEYEPQIGVGKSYARVTNEKIEEFLERHRIKYKARSNGQIVVRECPFCTKPHKNLITNLWTLNFKENSGAFLCFRCGHHGSWYDFIRFILGDTINFEKNSLTGETRDPEAEIRLRTERTIQVVEDCIVLHNQFLNVVDELNKLEKNPEEKIDDPTLIAHLRILQHLIGSDNPEQRHLSVETLKAYKIGIGEEMFKNEVGESVRIPVVCYPLFRPTVRKGKSERDLNMVDNIHYDCVRSKLRGVGKDLKHYQRFKPIGGHAGVFGLNTFQPNSDVNPSY